MVRKGTYNQKHEGKRSSDNYQRETGPGPRYIRKVQGHKSHLKKLAEDSSACHTDDARVEEALVKFSCCIEVLRVATNGMESLINDLVGSILILLEYPYSIGQKQRY